MVSFKIHPNITPQKQIASAINHMRKQFPLLLFGQKMVPLRARYFVSFISQSSVKVHQLPRHRFQGHAFSRFPTCNKYRRECSGHQPFSQWYRIQVIQVLTSVLPVSSFTFQGFDQFLHGIYFVFYWIKGFCRSHFLRPFKRISGTMLF